MVMYLLCHGQTLSIQDAFTKRKLKDVIVTNEKQTVYLYSDSSGQVNLSSIDASELITFHIVSYEPFSIQKAALQQLEWMVSLIPKPLVLKETMITGLKIDAEQASSIHIEALEKKTIDLSTAYTVSDLLTNVPGISQLSTGIGISKPSIRGLYGNRILVLLHGLRFDNQQWQDEHGLGISSQGISRIELIKGPMSTLYGSEAIGGVINLLEQEPPSEMTWTSEVQSRVHSNTLGLCLWANIQAKMHKQWFGIQGGIEQHSDYQDGNNQRVLNARFKTQQLKANYGFEYKNWQSNNYYQFAYNKYGFILDSLSLTMNPDERYAKTMFGPHHLVLLNTLSSVNNVDLKHSKFYLNLGVQSNYRAEDEGAGALSLQMHLFTAQYAMKWEKAIHQNLDLVIAHNHNLENNTNYGRRKIVPDAWLDENNISTYVNHHFNKVSIEYGTGFGLKYIKTLSTPTVNSADKDIPPFQQTRWFYNGMLGISLKPSPTILIQGNIASGVRAPNLAELSANGLHEGIYTYEIGDPKLKNEQNVNFNLDFHYENRTVSVSMAGFYNLFTSFIYLEPSDDEWFGFPIYRYEQNAARIYGSEHSFALHPSCFKGLELSLSYEQLIGRLKRGDYLPYMPANQLKQVVSYSAQWKEKYKFLSSITSNICLAQNRINPAEKNTPHYYLLDALISLEFQGKNTSCTWSIIGKNILNNAYFDHLSRLKNFGVLNPGRDIRIQCTILFNQEIKNLKQ